MLKAFNKLVGVRAGYFLPINTHFAQFKYNEMVSKENCAIGDSNIGT